MFINILVAICFIGIIGNILTFCVFTRQSFKKLSFPFYSKIMALNDIIALALSINKWTSFMFNLDLSLAAPIVCSLVIYSSVTLASISIWLLALIAFDRWLKIAQPIYYNVTLNKLKLKVALVVAVYICNFVYHAPMMKLDYKLVEANESKGFICLVQNPADNSYVYWLIFGNILFVSFLVNNFLAGMIWISLVRSRERLMIKNNTARIIRDRKFGVTSIIFNMACFIFKMPLSIFMLISNYLNTDLVTFEIAFNICLIIFVLDNAAAFFINISVNTLFRKEFSAMITTQI